MISEVMLKQFRSSMKMLDQAISKIPDEKWHDGTNEWHFSLTVYHILETIDFYSRESPEGMEWGRRADFDWDRTQDIQQDILPKITMDLVGTYKEEMSKKINGILEFLGDEGLQKSDGFHWFSNIYEKLHYLFRHTDYHIGELGRALREWDCELMKWE